MTTITLKDTMRAGHVTRWQIVRTARHQTLAEHMYLVTMLAQHIYGVICPAKSTHEEMLLLRWALLHDRPEILMGDIATPLKMKLRALVEYDPIEAIEKRIDPEYARVSDSVSGTAIAAVVKIADLQEGISFLHTEGMSSHAKMIMSKMIARHSALIDKCTVEHPGWRWQQCTIVLHELLNGADGMMSLEDETK